MGDPADRIPPPDIDDPFAEDGGVDESVDPHRLADPRPIHFVLHTYGGPPWARPERREGYAGPVLAETVGEAVALSLWGYEGVGSAEFPTEFWTWWAGYARARHLPPGGPGTRPARR